jgi:tRNA-dihydrouridine synthase B
VTANGDIDSPEKAREVLERTGADALMIGRAAQGRPWIFREIRHYLDCGDRLPSPGVEDIRAVILEHLGDHYLLYGEEAGVRSARKHLGWYVEGLAGGEAFRHEVNRLDSAAAQIAAVNRFFDRLAANGERLVYSPPAPPRPAAAAASWVEEALAA